jgi:chromate transporter
VSEAAAAPVRVGIIEIFTTFLFIGATSFGGGVVAYLRENLVAGRGWLDDEEFIRVMEISQTLPGLNATNMSAIIGDRLAGAPGALAAVLGMTIPGALTILALGALYAMHGNRPGAAEVLAGVAAGAAGLLTATVVQLGRKVVSGALDLALVIGTTAAISVLHLSLLTTLLTIGPLAVWLYRPRRNAGRGKS